MNRFISETVTTAQGIHAMKAVVDIAEVLSRQLDAIHSREAALFHTHLQIAVMFAMKAIELANAEPYEGIKD